jgi:hypothetical protein
VYVQNISSLGQHRNNVTGWIGVTFMLNQIETGITEKIGTSRMGSQPPRKECTEAY